MIDNYLESGNPNPEGEWSVADDAMTYARWSTELSPHFSLRVDRAVEVLMAGEEEAPRVPSGDLMPIPGSYTSLHVAVTYDDATCAYAGPLDVPIGTMLAVEFVNNSDVPAVMIAGDGPAIEVTAAAGRSGVGQVAMLDDALPIRCLPLPGEEGITRNAPSFPQRTPTEAEIDVTVTITDTACDVVYHREPLSGDLAGFLIRNSSGVDGGAYSWLRRGESDDQNLVPDFEDPRAYARWREVAAGREAFYARTLTEGDWGIGCWRFDDQRQLQTGGELRVPDPTG